MPVQPIEDILGGLSLIDPQNLKDNQFVTLKNFFYNQDKRLQTRYGIKKYFADVPDAVILVNSCDATTNFVASNDANTVALGTAIRGANSVSFNITATGAGTATLTNSLLSTSIVGKKGYFGFWFKVPTGFNTNLTAVKVRYGSDSSNYYEWTLGSLTEATNLFQKLAYSAATTTGSPVDATMTYFRLQVTYTVAYTNKTGILIDDLNSYSATNSKPVTSYFFFQRDDNALRTAICMSGTNTFHWNETEAAWDVIDTGLSEFETMTGMTTFHTRWSFCVYKNIIYMGNGVDNYRSFNGTLITQYAGQPKYRYLRYMGDRVFGADDVNPITLYYANALAADASNVSANSVVVGGDELGRINGLFDIGSFILSLKAKKIYTVNVSGSGSVSPIDTQNGAYSQRAIANVGNAILYQNDVGIDNLQQKAAATGATALESAPYTEDLQTLIKKITPIHLNSSCGLYIKKSNNYYWTFDTTNDNIPETTLVYSSLIGKTWSQYTYPAAFDYGYYIDSAGNYHYVMASGNVGIFYELETGFTDDDGLIEHELKTKAWDFKQPSTYKDFHSVDLFGLKNLGTDWTIEAYVDGELIYSQVLDDTYVISDVPSKTIASNPIAELPIGGGSPAETDVDLFPWKIRLGGEMMASGLTIQIRMFNNDIACVLTLDRMRLRYDTESEDIFVSANEA